MSVTDQRIADFVVRAWGAWAPGLNCREDWQEWQQGGQDVGIGDPPSPKSVARSLQRRLSPLAKSVFNALEPCVEGESRLPAVFCSSHGEIAKSLGMLETLQAGEELSPTAFSLSVHNAIGGLFSIAYDNHQEISVLAPGSDGMASGFIEALGLLQEGPSQVLLVFYDEPMPTFYPIAPFDLNLPFPCALAFRLSMAGEGMRLCFGRAAWCGQAGEQPIQLPMFIKFLLSEDRELQLGNGASGWQWQKI